MSASMALAFGVLLATSASAAQAPAGRLLVAVVDPSGAIVPQAVMTLQTTGGVVLRDGVSAGPDGLIVIEDLPAGDYIATISAPGFERLTVSNVRPGERPAVRRVRLRLQRIEEAVVVERDRQREALDPRGFSTFLSREQIDALPDAPDELAQALLALAPPGAVIRVDGFTGGAIPPKAQILSIRIPRLDSFSAQDHGGLDGLSYVDIVTRPGGGRLAGGAAVAMRTASMNARHPLAAERGSDTFVSTTLSLEGPVVRERVSFSAWLRSARQRDEQVRRVALPGGHIDTSPVVQPLHALTAGSRVTASLGGSQVLRASVATDRRRADNLGAAGYNLPERAYSSETTETIVRAATSGPLGRRAFIDARVQSRWTASDVRPDTEGPTIVVLDAFTSGGAQLAGGSRERSVEAAIDVDYGDGAHAWRTGLLLEHAARTSNRRTNDHGTYTFASLYDFEAGRPASYTRRLGDAALRYSDIRLGLYVQDDFRALRSLLVSYGARAEHQSLTGGVRMLPRASVAWSPFATGTTTLRVGWGLFSDWLPASVYEQSVLLDGHRQRDVHVIAPPYPVPPDTSAQTAPADRYSLAAGLELPGSVGASIGVEHQLTPALRLYVSYGRRWMHGLLRGENLNAPVSGMRPDPESGNVIEARGDAAGRATTVTVQAVTLPLRARIDVSALYTFTNIRTNTAGAFVPAATGEGIDGEWGPTAARHGVSASMTVRLGPLSVTLSPRWRSGMPYTVTTGHDDNRDGLFTDRPPGTGRNGSDGPSNWDVGARAAVSRRLGRAAAVPATSGDAVAALDTPGTAAPRVEIYAAAQNLMNRTNVVALGSVQTSPFFGKPAATSPGRRVEIGVRFAF